MPVFHYILIMMDYWLILGQSFSCGFQIFLSWSGNLFDARISLHTIKLSKILWYYLADNNSMEAREYLFQMLVISLEKLNAKKGSS